MLLELGYWMHDNNGLRFVYHILGKELQVSIVFQLELGLLCHGCFRVHIVCDGTGLRRDIATLVSTVPDLT